MHQTSHTKKHVFKIPISHLNFTFPCMPGKLHCLLLKIAFRVFHRNVTKTAQTETTMDFKKKASVTVIVATRLQLVMVSSSQIARTEHICSDNNDGPSDKWII